MKDYEVIVLLEKQERGEMLEWTESAPVEAQSLNEAGKIAKKFGREQALANNAKMVDAWACCDATGELSN